MRGENRKVLGEVIFTLPPQALSSAGSKGVSQLRLIKIKAPLVKLRSQSSYLKSACQLP